MKLRKVFGMVAVLLFGAVCAIVAANVMDYYRFHGVIKRLEGLSEEEFRALGDAAAKVKEPFRGKSAPGFEVLKPLKVNLWPGSTDILVYRLSPMRPRDDDHEIYLFVQIGTSEHNQEIMYFANSGGGQTQKVLWNRNPEFVKAHSPGDRLITITEWSMSHSRAWIVRGDEILVVDDSGVVGGEPSIAGRRKLGVEEFRRIQRAMAELPPSARGKVYDAGWLDGTTLDISFDPDGKGTAESVQISNTWVEQFHPLLAAISELAPPDCPISFIEYATEQGYMDDRSTTVYTRYEWTRLGNRYDSPVPWWCVWRKLVD